MLRTCTSAINVIAQDLNWSPTTCNMYLTSFIIVQFPLSIKPIYSGVWGINNSCLMSHFSRSWVNLALTNLPLNMIHYDVHNIIYIIFSIKLKKHLFGTSKSIEFLLDVVQNVLATKIFLE
jgi:hypothetical protein